MEFGRSVGAPLTREQVTEIFTFHPSVRFVKLVDKDGKLLDSVKRAGLEALEPPEETEKLLSRWTVARGLTSGADNYFGAMKTIIVRREKLVELLFPLSEYMVIIYAHPSFPLEKTAQLEGMLNKMRTKGK